MKIEVIKSYVEEKLNNANSILWFGEDVTKETEINAHIEAGKILCNALDTLTLIQNATEETEALVELFKLFDEVHNEIEKVYNKIKALEA